MDNGKFGAGHEKSVSEQERRRAQSRARMEDINASTENNKVTMADLKKGKI